MIDEAYARRWWNNKQPFNLAKELPAWKPTSISNPVGFGVGEEYDRGNLA